jgi:hypothetical protein
MRVGLLFVPLALAFYGCQYDGNPGPGRSLLTQILYPYECGFYARKLRPGTTNRGEDGILVLVGEDGVVHPVGVGSRQESIGINSPCGPGSDHLALAHAGLSSRYIVVDSLVWTHLFRWAPRRPLHLFPTTARRDICPVRWYGTQYIGGFVRFLREHYRSTHSSHIGSGPRRDAREASFRPGAGGRIRAASR